MRFTENEASAVSTTLGGAAVASTGITIGPALTGVQDTTATSVGNFLGNGQNIIMDVSLFAGTEDFIGDSSAQANFLTGYYNALAPLGRVFPLGDINHDGYTDFAVAEGDSNGNATSILIFEGNAAGTLRLIVYLALAMVIMVLDHRNGWLWRARGAASWVVEPVYRLANLPGAGVRSLTVAFADRKLLTEQNQRLREDLLLANARLNRMAGVAEQNQHLKQLLDTRRSLELNVQLARVVGVD
ncbi:MAG TPA: hypothetical protein PK867_26730, partial [Pirellulales bacterium]|nr:hypothetical protein [Pirellulales bacterium]